MNLARESKRRKIPESYVWRVLLEHRWNNEILQDSKCLNATKKLEIVFEVFQELGIAYSSYTWFLEEDLSLGTKFYSALTYCPDHLLETATLSVFFESLLDSESLRSVVAATMHNIQPRAGNRIKDSDQHLVQVLGWKIQLLPGTGHHRPFNNRRNETTCLTESSIPR